MTNGRAVPSHRWTDDLLFLRKFLQQGHAIAALRPSSRWLGRKSLKYIDFDRAQVLLELGAGTGTVTREIVRRLRPHSRLIAVELDPDFCAVLRRQFTQPNVQIVEADAACVADLLLDQGIHRLDAIISGLPLFYLPHDTQVAVLRLADRFLGPAGRFHQLTHTPWIRERFYRRLFEDVRFEIVLRNVPPGGVYFCRGVRREAVA